MTRSRLVVLASVAVVSVGVLTGLGALYLDPARAAVGPLPAEGLSLPADTRFVVGMDVRRFVASPLYRRYSERFAVRPQAFSDLEDKTGIDPERDLDQVLIAGRGTASREDGIVLVMGRFDRDKLIRAIETQKKGVTWREFQGTTVYVFGEGGGKGSAAAFLDDRTAVLGAPRAVEGMIAARAQGEASLRSNSSLIALLEGVAPGSTFWMVGDQTLMDKMPKTIPGPGGSGSSLQLPGLKSLVVTGDLDPVMAVEAKGEASDEAAARNLADVVRGLVALAALQANQRPELKGLASAVSVTTEGAHVRVNARFPYELIDSLHPRKAAGPREGVSD